MPEHEERTPVEEEPAAVAEAPADVSVPEAEREGHSTCRPTHADDAEEDTEKVEKDEDSIGLSAVASARTALNKSEKGIAQLKKALRWKIHLLDEQQLQDLQDAHNGRFEDDILDGWVEELLRFLALKTLQDDNTRPFQLAPSGPVTVAWKALMAMPSTYAAVSLAMGNTHPIDEDFVAPDVALEADEERHLTKRLNATMRAYTRCFEEQPPALFWKGVQEPREPNPLVQIYRTARQLWTGMANCGNDALETMNGCTSPKVAMDASSEANDILVDEATADAVDVSSVHANPFITAE